MSELCSIFKEEMDSFLHHLRSLRRDVRCFITVFNRLDQFLSEKCITEKQISKALFEQFVQCFNVSQNCLYNYLSHFRTFADYLCSLGFHVYKPELPKYRFEYVPYVYSDEEWMRIIEAADNLIIPRCPLYSIQMPILLRILYGCGTRITETLCLKVRDVDLKNGVLTLTQTKNGKQRLVPMDKSLSMLVGQFITKQELNSDDYLFHMQRNNERWNTESADNCFDHILKTAQISYWRKQRHDRGPCLHCVRHTFVMNSLKKSDREGRCFDETVPFLSTYLGHSGIRDTDKYLRFCYELYDDAVEKIEAYTESLFPEVS